MNSRSVVIEKRKTRPGKKRINTSSISVPKSNFNGNRKGIRLDANKEFDRLKQSQLEPT